MGNQILEHIGQPIFDVRFSGSTCIGVLTFGNKLYIANVGDSRAILVSEKTSAYGHHHESFNSRSLSRDHKPSDADES